jgi:hypothetical protein
MKVKSKFQNPCLPAGRQMSKECQSLKAPHSPRWGEGRVRGGHLELELGIWDLEFSFSNGERSFFQT